MSFFALPATPWTSIAWFALEVSLAVLLAGAAERFSDRVFWRRTCWQASFIAVTLICLLEASGASRGLARWVRGVHLQAVGNTTTPRTPRASLAALSLSNLSLPPFSDRSPEQGRAPGKLKPSRTESRSAESDIGCARWQLSKSPVPTLSQPPRNRPTGTEKAGPVALSFGRQKNIRGEPDWWLYVWWLGSFILLARGVVGRLVLNSVRRRGSRVREPYLAARLRSLSQMLGLAREIRLIASPSLKGPIAFGLRRPTIALPPDFSTHFSKLQQEAMLTHELAHLAGRDPFWFPLAYWVCALFWWHPLVWWAGHRLRFTSELAADEASSLLSGGPEALADSLVTLGKRLRPVSLPTFLPVSGSGFRSALGRRVERLFEMKPRTGWLGRTRRPWVFLASAPASLSLLLTLSTAWMEPQNSVTGDSVMKSIVLQWKHALAGVAIFAGVNTLSVQGGPAPTSDSAGAVAVSATNRVPIKTSPSEPRTTPKAQPSTDSSGGSASVPALNNSRSAGPIPRSSGRSTGAVKGYGGGGYASSGYGSGSLPPEGASAFSAGAPQVIGGGRAGGQIGSPVARNQAQKAILERLHSIKLKEVQFDGQPLGDVVDYLNKESQARDPTGQGVNFLVAQRAEAVGPFAVDPNTGMPLPQSSEPPDLRNVTIELPNPLRNVTLEDVLQVLPLVAERPIRCSIENYGVVFSPGPAAPAVPQAPQPRLVVCTYRVDTSSFFPGLEAAFGVQTSGLALQVSSAQNPSAGMSKALTPQYGGMSKEMAQRYGLTPQNGPAPQPSQAHQPRMPRDPIAHAGKVRHILEQWLQKLGIAMSTPGKAVYYNDLTGILMLRATPDDQSIAGAAIQTLGGSDLSQPK